MRQYAWLELFEKNWHLITELTTMPNQNDRNWPDLNLAMVELNEEGWKLTDPYQNELSIKARLPQNIPGYGLIRTIH
jgi:hypothetical protein